MKISRPVLLLVLAFTLVTWGAWYVYSGWGLVSLNMENAPISKVLKSISRQGNIEIVSNLDPSTPISIHVHRVSPVEALDVVAIRSDSAWRLAYLGAPSRDKIETALDAFKSAREVEGWTSFGSGGGFGMFAPASGQALDLRKIQWSPSDAAEFHALLEDAGDKTGVMLAIPNDWQASPARPAAGAVSKTIPQLFTNAGGTSRELFLLRATPSRDDADAESPRGMRGGGSWIGSRSPSSGTQRGPRNPEAMQARAEAQIALLPKEEQSKAREELDAMKKIWQEVSALPDDQRREKMREVFNRPEVAERMEQRRLAREAKMTPDQRIQRSQRYWGRKAQEKYKKN